MNNLKSNSSHSTIENERKISMNQLKRLKWQTFKNSIFIQISENPISVFIHIGNYLCSFNIQRDIRQQIPFEDCKLEW